MKIGFDLDADAGASRETMWGELVADDAARVLNIPLLAFGVAYHDVVRVKPDGELFVSQGPIVRGGHSTYRLMVDPDFFGQPFETAWRGLAVIGCWYESLSAKFLAVDVPPRTDVYAAYSLFETGQKNGIWTFEEGHCGHPLEKSG